MTPKAPSTRDVAEAAGVCAPTVSRALSAPDKVSAPTHAAVFRAVEQTGYRVNMAARNLRKRETGAVAMLVPNLANPFFSAILSGVAEAMSVAGYNKLGNDTTPFGQVNHRFAAFANARHVDGLIVLDGLLDPEALDRLGPPQIRPPTVYACEWCDLAERPRVIIDNEVAGRDAVARVLGLGRCRGDHLCGPPKSLPPRRPGSERATAPPALAFRPRPGIVAAMAGQTETILTRILEGIDRGEIAPGDPIEEKALIEAYGVSRTPLREAIIRLEAMGLVHRPPRKGAVLFKPTLEEFLAILEIHAKLEGLAAGLAARRHGPEELARIEAVVAACEAHAAEKGDNDPEGYYQLNLRFHEAVALAAGNPVLVDTIKTNARKLLAYYRARYRYSGAIAASARDHRAMVELIRRGQAAEAEAFMIDHVQFDQITAMDLLAALE